MVEFYMICGYIGSGLFTIHLFPQLYKTYKTKKANDISYGWQLCCLGGTGFSLIFAFHTPYPHMKIGLSIEFMNVLAIIFLKRLYSKKKIMPIINE